MPLKVVTSDLSKVVKSDLSSGTRGFRLKKKIIVPNSALFVVKTGPGQIGTGVK